MALATDPFKGQRDLSLRNDFNRQWPETAGIATLSQQMALMLKKGPLQIGWCSQYPPTMLRRGGRDAERHRTQN